MDSNVQKSVFQSQNAKLENKINQQICWEIFYWQIDLGMEYFTIEQADYRKDTNKDFICATGHWMSISNHQNWKELLMCEKLISFSTNDCLSPTWGKLFWQVDVILSILFLLETLTSYIIIYLLNRLHWHQYH